VFTIRDDYRAITRTAIIRGRGASGLETRTHISPREMVEYSLRREIKRSATPVNAGPSREDKKASP